MKIISFAYTTPALLAKQKTVTRRYWDPVYAGRFKIGETIQAWDKSPRYGGKKVAEIRLLALYHQNMLNAPDSDYNLEGFDYMVKNNITLGKNGPLPTLAYWRAWKGTREDVFVVRFELMKIIEWHESNSEYYREMSMQ